MKQSLRWRFGNAVKRLFRECGQENSVKKKGMQVKRKLNIFGKVMVLKESNFILVPQGTLAWNLDESPGWDGKIANSSGRAASVST